MLTHVRNMLPPKRELIPEMIGAMATEPPEPVYQRDPTGVLLLVGETHPKPVYGFTPVLEKNGTPKLVESYTTLDPDGRERLHEGSLVAVDLVCRDCGAALKPGNGHDFYYLVCARIDDRSHAMIRATSTDAEGNPRTHVRLDPEEMAKPYANCVLECGRVGL